MKLVLFKYKYLPYELRFLENEIVMLGGKVISKSEHELEVSGLSSKSASSLTYIEKIVDEKGNTFETLQTQRELINGKSSTHYQSTRYGPHGIHEYKGKFNPQTPRSLLIQNFSPDATILDPFTGSGTTLIEARSLGIKCFGVELNPLAFEIASSKILFEELKELPHLCIDTKLSYDVHPDHEYLSKWFTEEQYKELVLTLATIKKHGGPAKKILSIVLSDQIRNNSLQDPRDLRVRRLKEPPTSSGLIKDFEAKYAHLADVHKRWIQFRGVEKSKVHLFNGDSSELSKYISTPINGTVCSPPYFSALPYIDTYRLSMVALGIISSKEIAKSERKLIGARDISTTEKKFEISHIEELPKIVSSLVKQTIKSLEKDDAAGFRKQAVPYNLIRYCRSMRNVLASVYKCEQKGAMNLWVVGPNKTTLNDVEITIDTPLLIAELAKSLGFKSVEVEPVNAYGRFDIHSKNSIRQESIVKFRK